MKENINNNNFLFILFSFVLCTMSLSIVSISVGFTMRVGNIFILLLFGLIILDEARKNKLNESLLIFFLFFTILLFFISKNSEYSKIGELKFIIKYGVIFPAVFYIGQWCVQVFTVKRIIRTFEMVMLFYVFMAFLLFVYPIGFLYHDRGPLSGFQGTFFEPGWYALVVGSTLMTALILRWDYNLNFTIKEYYIYGISLLSIFMSKNKTVWLSVIIILIFLLIMKIFISNSPNTRKSIQKLKSFNSIGIIFIGIIVILVFFTINSLLTEPIISMAIIEDKLNNERGKAFLAAIKLLENSNWLGAYGLGFIEQYFSVYTDRIIGLGAGSGMIFNSYLDIWISAGILGLVYHFTLLGMSFSRSHLYTLIIPVYWFIAANTNPVIIDEYYYLFLGISYGLLLKEKKGKY